ncbi:unnamed protein product [Peronospora farinosa]|uniref:CCHC-type domain-containing protein n=1 Tax=Peronospora farinosa TaxID=134698 RepID=A0AAV0TQM4_9STRA|nr:unnamed protein product [Peronospora farinosa]
MSPTIKREAGAAAQAKPTKVTDSFNKTAEEQLEEKPAAPIGAMEKLIRMLGDISERLNRLESSQKEHAGKNVKGPSESLFGSVLGAGMTLQALEEAPPRKKSPADLGGRRQDFGNDGTHRGAYGGVEARMGALPEPARPRQEAPPNAYPSVGLPDRFFVGEEPQVYGIPDAMKRKLALQPFEGKELYQGLGSGFIGWGKEFVRQVGFAERACGFAWPEGIKVKVLGQHLGGKAQIYYRRQVESWWVENQTLDQDAANFQHEDLTRTEHETLHGTEGSTQKLDGPLPVSDGRKRCMRRLDIHRPDSLRQAEELAQFAQQVEIESHVKNLGRDVVNAVETRKESKERVTSRPRRNIEVSDERVCYKCGEAGHIRSKCPQVRKKGAGADFTFANGDSGDLHEDHWILDSGSSRHLVNDLSLLINPEDCRGECLTAASDGDVLRVTKQGSVDIKVVALGVMKTIRLLEVQYAACPPIGLWMRPVNLERNIISYGKLEAKGCVLEYRGGGRVLTSGSKGAPIMNVDRINNVLVVKVLGHRAKVMGMSKEIMVAAINSTEYESDSDVQRGTLMHFHRRLGHLCFDTIIKMAKDPASCIKLTDTRRMNCLACAQGKQTKQVQSKVDTGMNSLVVKCQENRGPGYQGPRVPGYRGPRVQGPRPRKVPRFNRGSPGTGFPVTRDRSTSH